MHLYFRLSFCWCRQPHFFAWVSIKCYLILSYMYISECCIQSRQNTCFETRWNNNLSVGCNQSAIPAVTHCNVCISVFVFPPLALLQGDLGQKHTIHSTSHLEGWCLWYRPVLMNLERRKIDDWLRPIGYSPAGSRAPTLCSPLRFSEACPGQTASSALPPGF